MSLRILVDADACPVKEEICTVAERHGVPAVFVSNSAFRIPSDPLFSRVIVSGGFDAADDWIAEQSNPQSVVITADILLAERCLKTGATVLDPKGKAFTGNNIGMSVAVRAIMSDLRAGAMQSTAGGPAPYSKADRSAFLSALHNALNRLKRT